MLIIDAKLPTFNLPIKRVLPKLFQSFIYSTIDDKEHRGYKHPNGKVFKAMNFKIFYRGNELKFYYTALNKEYEKEIAKRVLLDGLKLGEIHFSSIELALKDRKPKGESVKVGGFVAAAIKDGKSSKKIYLEPKTNKFQEIVYNHTLQKYEALFGKSYDGDFEFKTIGQKPKERLFFYDKSAIKAWYGVFEIKADMKLLQMVYDTGLGARSMEGLGFVEEIGVKNG